MAADAGGGQAQNAHQRPEVQDALGKAGLDKQNPDVEKLLQALAAQQQATGLLQKVSAIKDKAMKCMNPAERKHMLQEAYDKEVEANGQSAWARRLQSGVWQGGGAGAGIGGGVGMGLGAVVGTLVGGVVSLPTTALGGLVGAGVGGITGPFVKLDQTKAKQVAEREKAKGKSPEEIEKAVREEACEETSEDDPEANARLVEGTTSEVDAQGGAISSDGTGAPGLNTGNGTSEEVATDLNSPSPSTPEYTKPKKKPRKLQIRSGQEPAA